MPSLRAHATRRHASRAKRPRKAQQRTESGNAVVESIGVIAILLVPALLATISISEVIAARSGALAAAREAARAYVRAESGAEAARRMQAVAHLVLADRGLRSEGSPELACSATPCLSPGATVTVSVAARAELPLTGRTLAIRQKATMPVDNLRAGRP